ncbi:hypothetical protein GCM10009799_17250 [Nocardiopsis rhodophaea]|uniref:Transposase n=1 Tax=Nocardiopsis rhodophaea TaxID=280238 RepID=A0ABP5E8D9_9ACTN
MVLMMPAHLSAGTAEIPPRGLPPHEIMAMGRQLNRHGQGRPSPCRRLGFHRTHVRIKITLGLPAQLDRPGKGETDSSGGRGGRLSIRYSKGILLARLTIQWHN